MMDGIAMVPFSNGRTLICGGLRHSARRAPIQVCVGVEDSNPDRAHLIGSSG